MPSVVRAFGGGRPGELPIPTVGRDATTGQWVALTEEIKRTFLHAAADGINAFANSVARLSLKEVPKGPRGNDEAGEYGELAASCRYPGNDPESEAFVITGSDHIVGAYISYNTPYAAVQHEGAAVMEHEHPIIPGARHFFEKTGIEQQVTVEWVVRDWTTGGTKDHYLSDPMRSRMPYMEGVVGRRVREHLTFR